MVKLVQKSGNIIRSTKRLEAQARKFNLSGRVVTADDLMLMPNTNYAGRTKSGAGKWKSWTPEAVQRAAFAKGSLRQVVASMKDGHGKSAGGSRSPWHVACCKAVCSQAILQGQNTMLQRLRDVSVHSKPLTFWITNTMFDETKLWYSVRGFGRREFSTLAVHGQVTWADDAGVHDEDLFYPPKAMVRYAGASQWSALQKDGPAGILHKPEEAPRAKFHGHICAHDSHAVNRLTVKTFEESVAGGPCHVAELLQPAPRGQSRAGSDNTVESAWPSVDIDKDLRIW